MPTPNNRTPIRVGRGSYSNLNSSVNDIQEGEIVYATDQDTLYVKESGSLVNTGVPATNAVTDTAQTFTAAQRASVTTLTSGTNVAVDFAASNNYTLTLDQNVTIDNPTNMVVGQSGSIFLVQDGTGSRTAAWGSYWDFAGGVAPTLSTAAAAIDRVDYIVRGASSIHTVFTGNYS